jgi:hypothetical protein
MTEHVHGCLSCRPDMVPDFERTDDRYHDGEKCDHSVYALVNGVDPGYTTGIFEGPDGWVLSASRGYDASRVHPCPNHRQRVDEAIDPIAAIQRVEICVEPVFGNVEARHRCPDRRKGAH